MAIEWDASLATGNGLIDTQHRELFARVNKLLAACSTGKGREAVVEMIGYLEDYAKRHFAAEEKEMRLIGYPDYEAHRQQHAEFNAKLLELRQSVNGPGPGTYLVILTNRILVDWLIHHVKKVDKALAVYLGKAQNR
jgi:hemerythrin